MSLEPDPDADISGFTLDSNLAEHRLTMGEVQKVEDVLNETEGRDPEDQPRNPCPICESGFNRKGPQLRTGPRVQPEA